MSSQAQAIVIALQDGVAPSIAPNLAEIGRQAVAADKGLTGLKSTLDSISNTSGVNSLRTVLKDIASGTNQLNTATSKIGITSGNTAAQINKLAGSYNTLNFAVQSAITTLQSYTPAAAAARGASSGFSASTRTAASGLQSVGSSAHGVITPIIGASAAIRGLEGNFGTNVRAGERFLVTTLKLGPALQAAFPLFGALALLGILDILVEHVKHVIKAYNDLGTAAIEAEISAIAAGDKIIKAKNDGLFSAATFGRVLQGDFGSAPDTIDVVNVQTELRNLAKQRAEYTAQIRANEAGLTGEAQQSARTAGLKQERDLLRDQLNTINQTIVSLTKQNDARKTIITERVDRVEGVVKETTQVGLLDPSQRNAVEKELSAARDGFKDLLSEVKILDSAIEESGKKEPLKAALDQTKEARAQLKQFDLELDNLKSKPGVLNLNDKRDLLQNQLQRALPGNKTEISGRLATTNESIDRQTQGLDLLAKKYRDEVEALGLYSDALKIKHEQDKIDIEATKLGVSLTDEKIVGAKEKAKTAIEEASVQRELNRLFQEANEPLITYNAGLKALNKLEKDGDISHAQAVAALNQLGLTFKRSTQPLFEYTHQLSLQSDLFGKYGTELEIATQIQQVNEELRAKGLSLSSQETQKLGTFLTQLQQQRSIQQTINQLYEKNIGQVEKLTNAYTAVTLARRKGIITEQQEQVELTKIKVQLADLQITLGKATGKDFITSIVGNYIKDFQGFTREATTLFQNVFQNIADGAANALGRAIAYGENLGDALKDVARSALSELISGFIKLGIQELILHTIGKSLASAAVAQSVAEASIVANAWAPAAALVSLATIGANAAPADAALLGTTGLSQILANVKAFSTGGLVTGPGTSTSDSILGRLSHGEGVLNANAVRNLGIDNFNALNRGVDLTNAKQIGTAGIPTINIIHDGSTSVTVERLSHNEVRLIAKQEAIDAVEKHAPNVIAGQVSNPNSRVSKTLAIHTTAERRR